MKTSYSAKTVPLGTRVAENARLCSAGLKTQIRGYRTKRELLRCTTPVMASVYSLARYLLRVRARRADQSVLTRLKPARDTRGLQRV